MLTLDLSRTFNMNFANRYKSGKKIEIRIEQILTFLKANAGPDLISVALS